MCVGKTPTGRPCRKQLISGKAKQAKTTCEARLAKPKDPKNPFCTRASKEVYNGKHLCGTHLNKEKMEKKYAERIEREFGITVDEYKKFQQTERRKQKKQEKEKKRLQQIEHEKMRAQEEEKISLQQIEMRAQEKKENEAFEEFKRTTEWWPSLERYIEQKIENREKKYYYDDY